MANTEKIVMSNTEIPVSNPILKIKKFKYRRIETEKIKIGTCIKTEIQNPKNSNTGFETDTQNRKNLNTGIETEKIQMGFNPCFINKLLN